MLSASRTFGKEFKRMRLNPRPQFRLLAQRFAPWLVPGASYLGLALWFSASGWLRLGGDSARYVQGAEHVLSGLPTSGQEGAFPGYVLVLAGIRWIGFGWDAVVAFQLLIGGLALAALIDATRRMAGGFAGTVSGLLYVAHPEIVQFAFFVLTDSLYTSGLVLTIYAIGRAKGPPVSSRWGALTLSLALGIAAIRPQGWLVALVIIAWLASEAIRQRSMAWASTLVGILLLAGTVLWGSMQTGLISESPLSALEHLGDFSTHVYEGTVIWGDSTSNLLMPAAEGSGVGAVAEYCLSHPQPCTRLFIRRILLALVGVRPYFSAPHNTIIAGRLIAMYSLAAIGILARPLGSTSSALVAIILVHLVFIGVVWIDWDGRFMLYVVPPIALIAGLGAGSLQRKALGRRWDREGQG